MSKLIKGYIQKQFESDFDGLRDFMIVSLMGVEGQDNNALRGELLKKNISVRIVSNSLAIRAFGEMGLTGLDEILVGPCAIAYGGDSIVDLAKEVVGWDKKLKPFIVKGGVLEGEILDADRAKQVAKMKTRGELQADVLGAALSPGANLVGAAMSPASVIAGCIKTLVDQKEEAA